MPSTGSNLRRKFHDDVDNPPATNPQYFVSIVSCKVPRSRRPKSQRCLGLPQLQARLRSRRPLQTPLALVGPRRLNPSLGGEAGAVFGGGCAVSI